MDDADATHITRRALLTRATVGLTLPLAGGVSLKTGNAASRTPLGKIRAVLGGVTLRGLENVRRFVKPGESVYPFDRFAVLPETRQGVCLDLAHNIQLYGGPGTVFVLSTYHDIRDHEGVLWPEVLLATGICEVRVYSRGAPFVGNIPRVRVVSPVGSVVAYAARAAIEATGTDLRVALIKMENAGSGPGVHDDGNDASGPLDGTNGTDTHGVVPDAAFFDQTRPWLLKPPVRQPLVSASNKFGDVWLSIPGHSAWLDTNSAPRAPALVGEENYRKLAERFDYLSRQV